MYGHRNFFALALGIVCISLPLNSSGTSRKTFNRLYACFPFGFFRGSMPRTVLRTIRSGRLRCKGPFLGWPISKYLFASLTMLSLLPDMAAFSAFTTIIFSPWRRRLAMWLAIRPRISPVASITATRSVVVGLPNDFHICAFRVFLHQVKE